MVFIPNSNIPLLLSEVANADIEKASKRVRRGWSLQLPSSGIPAGHYMPVRYEVVLEAMLPNESGSAFHRGAIGELFNRNCRQREGVYLGQYPTHPQSMTKVVMSVINYLR
jgi:hypothetical protein